MGYFLCGVKCFHIMHNLTLKAIALRYDPLSYLLNCVYTIWLNKLACFRKVLDLCFRTFNAHLAPSFQHSLNPATYFRWHLYAKYMRGRTKSKLIIKNSEWSLSLTEFALTHKHWINLVSVSSVYPAILPVAVLMGSRAIRTLCCLISYF